MSATATEAVPTKAAWNRVHMAVVRGGLWSPACTEERGWVAPLAVHELAGQITCKVCHPIAMAQNQRETGDLAWTDETEDPCDPCDYCAHENTQHAEDGCRLCPCAVPQ